MAGNLFVSHAAKSQQGHFNELSSSAKGMQGARRQRWTKQLPFEYFAISDRCNVGIGLDDQRISAGAHTCGGDLRRFRWQHHEQRQRCLIANCRNPQLGLLGLNLDHHSG